MCNLFFGRAFAANINREGWRTLACFTIAANVFAIVIPTPIFIVEIIFDPHLFQFSGAGLAVIFPEKVDGLHFTRIYKN